ncbi:MAG: flagellar motor switch protein FliN, partial [Candidatus Hydrogenedentes bacterium]|nr:flagellar motor switch protein FliN [Candidatus Hydrogenedentota bacterium]
LGACTMLVRDVLALQRGSVVQLSKLAGEMTDIYLNGLPLARGEVVVIGDTLHVRIGEIVGQEKQGDVFDAAE